MWLALWRGSTVLRKMKLLTASFAISSAPISALECQLRKASAWIWIPYPLYIVQQKQRRRFKNGVWFRRHSVLNKDPAQAGFSFDADYMDYCWLHGWLPGCLAFKTSGHPHFILGNALPVWFKKLFQIRKPDEPVLNNYERMRPFVEWSQIPRMTQIISEGKCWYAILQGWPYHYPLQGDSWRPPSMRNFLFHDWQGSQNKPGT